MIICWLEQLFWLGKLGFEWTKSVLNICLDNKNDRRNSGGTLRQRYLKNIPKISQRYPKDISKISQRYLKDILKISQKYPKDIPKISKRYPKDVPKISKRYPKEIYLFSFIKMCPRAGVSLIWIWSAGNVC